MSYLDSPRLHFAGRFQADTSTVNNDVRHFDNSKFRPNFQQIMETKGKQITKWNGYWNPEGTGAWRMLGCTVTGAALDGRPLTEGSDPVLGMQLTGADDRVAGKLVDLDPQQQMVSEIWGLRLRLQSTDGKTAVRGDFDVAPFCDLWRRQQNATNWMDQTLAAVYQSHLIDVEWGHFAGSSLLEALREASVDSQLSIRMNVFGYDRTPDAPDYTTGRVVGTIGPASSTGPKRFTLGRHLMAKASGSPFAPDNGVFHIRASVDSAKSRVTADFGNALPITGSSGELENLGALYFAVLKDANLQQGHDVDADQVALLDSFPYRRNGWYDETAGIVDFDFGGDGWVVDHIGDHPLALLQETGSGFKILNRETLEGLYLRADQFVFRLNAGQDATADFWATRYGVSLQTTIQAQSTNGFMGNAGTGATLPDIPVPTVGKPEDALSYVDSLHTDSQGYAALTLSASAEGPKQGKAEGPRIYLDGQLYGVDYVLADLPKGSVESKFDYLSILLWNSFEAPARPTWYRDIQPILQQYANLYPIMSQRLFDLADYDQVVRNLAILELSFRLPISDPNSMPVTRDLSDAKRQMILDWLTTPDPATGKPYLGDAAEAQDIQPEAASRSETQARSEPEEAGESSMVSSKIAFFRQTMALQERAEQERAQAAHDDSTEN